MNREEFRDTFNVNFTVPVTDRGDAPVWQTVNLGFAEGANVQFKLKPKEGADNEQLSNNVFLIKHQSLGEGGEIKTLRIYQSETLPH